MFFKLKNDTFILIIFNNCNSKKKIVTDGFLNLNNKLKNHLQCKKKRLFHF